MTLGLLLTSQETNDMRKLRQALLHYLIYHPNATAEGREATADATKAPRVSLDLKAASGTFRVEWSVEERKRCKSR